MPLTASVLLLTYAAVRYAWQSLSWKMLCDLPVMLYDGLLIDTFGRVPYRDFFETNPPGTMVVYAALQLVIQGHELRARILDLAVLSSISFLTCLALRAHGLRSGLLASACFAVAYFNTGFEHSLQREYLCVFPLALSLAISFNLKNRGALSYVVFFTLGALAGLVFSIKPPLAAAWAPLVVLSAAQALGARNGSLGYAGTIVRIALCTLAGALLIPLCLLAWLYATDALGPFFRMAANYWPLYAQLSGQAGIADQGPSAVLNRYWFNTVLTSAQWWSATRALGDFDKLAFMGLISGIVILRDKNYSRQMIALWGVLLLTYLYIPVSVKFWRYHYIPLFYALSLSAGLVVSRQFLKQTGISSCASLVIAAALLCCFPLSAATDWRTWKFFESPTLLHVADIDFIEKYLREHAGPDDLIMPLETADGTTHALYRMKRPLPGRFLYDFQFYHHTENPYIQELRAQMLSDLRRLKPKFIVRSTKPWRPPAENPSWNFPELDDYVNKNYTPATDNSRRLQVLVLGKSAPDEVPTPALQ